MAPEGAHNAVGGSDSRVRRSRRRHRPYSRGVSTDRHEDVPAEPTEGGAAAEPVPPPLVVRPRPRTVVLTAAAVVVLAWLAVLVVDVWNVAGLGEIPRHALWVNLFNSRPVEWLQWVALGAAGVGGGYLAGALRGRGQPALTAFVALLAAGAVVMLLEEAGDIRHSVSLYVLAWFGEQPLPGLHYRVVSDLPFLTLVALLPVYALLRHGRAVWTDARGARPYLVATYGLYGIAALASGLRHLGGTGGHADRAGLYADLGAALHATVFSGITQPAYMDLTELRFLLVDSIVEESIELLAAASLLGLVLAVASAAAAAEP